MNNKIILKYIYAFCLGDGGVYYSGNNARFQANNLEKHADYVYWRASVLENLTKVNVWQVQDNRPGRQPILQTSTLSHPKYTQVREDLYIQNIKRVSPHQLTFMDWESLAILHMDDGSLYLDARCNATPQVMLSTKGFSYGDNVLIKRAIEEKLGIVFNIHRQKNPKGNYYYFLRLRAKDYSKFADNVAPYIQPSFEYKIIRTSNIDDIVSSAWEHAGTTEMIVQ